jgi:hypothetical protein
MPRCSATGLDFRIIPAGFNAPLEFLTGFTEIFEEGHLRKLRFDLSETVKFGVDFFLKSTTGHFGKTCMI